MLPSFSTYEIELGHLPCEVYGFLKRIFDPLLIIIDAGKHPFHLHGHNFQAIARSEESAGVFDPTNATQTQYPEIPMRRDTFVLNPQGHVVLRFKADNPGVWLFQ